MIVLDTNVISELMRVKPAEEVMRWIDAQPRNSLCTTTVTQAEVLYGLESLPQGKRRDTLLEVARTVFDTDFSGRVFPFDGDAARAYAHIAATRRRAGRPIPQLDGQIAAIAVAIGSELATRNRSDFEGCGIELHDPWTGQTFSDSPGPAG